MRVALDDPGGQRRVGVAPDPAAGADQVFQDRGDVGAGAGPLQRQELPEVADGHVGGQPPAARRGKAGEDRRVIVPRQKPGTGRVFLRGVPGPRQRAKGAEHILVRSAVFFRHVDAAPFLW